MVVQVNMQNALKYGIKRTCKSCGVNFFDMDKYPSECPNCGAIYELHVNARSKNRSIENLDFDKDIPFDLSEDEKDKTDNIKVDTLVEEDDLFDS